MERGTMTGEEEVAKEEEPAWEKKEWRRNT